LKNSLLEFAHMSQDQATSRALLIIGSKNYSSWSLRPWLFLRKVGFEFREQIIYFDDPDYQMQIAAVSPSRRVPVAIDRGVKIWDSLAICEYAADATGRGLPLDRGARAVARAAAAEMHSGFQTLRNEYPMNVRARGRHVALTPPLKADIERIDQIWSQCRQDHGGAGGWLFGEFSIADAMFAPVFFRFQTYGAKLRPASQAYLEHALADPLLREWQEASSKEGHPLPEVDRVGIPGGSA
jgi:glutathione S-transferase